MEGGEVVYRARSLYASYSDSIIDDTGLCDSIVYYGGGGAKRDESEAETVTAQNNTEANNTQAMDAEAIMYSLFPNPAKDKVTITCSRGFCIECRIVIYDLAGREILNKLLPEGQYSCEVSTKSVQSGLYLTVITNEKKDLFNTKLSIIK